MTTRVCVCVCALTYLCVHVSDLASGQPCMLGLVYVYSKCVCACMHRYICVIMCVLTFFFLSLHKVFVYEPHWSQTRFWHSAHARPTPSANLFRKQSRQSLRSTCRVDPRLIVSWRIWSSRRCNSFRSWLRREIIHTAMVYRQTDRQTDRRTDGRTDREETDRCMVWETIWYIKKEAGRLKNRDQKHTDTHTHTHTVRTHTQSTYVRLV